VVGFAFDATNYDEAVDYIKNLCAEQGYRIKRQGNINSNNGVVGVRLRCSASGKHEGVY
jgi:hypothetical protein